MDREQALEKHGKTLEAGTVLFYEGDPASKLWIIHEGYVQLTKRVCSEEILIETLGPGDFCGELSLISGNNQNVTATVVEAAKLITVEASQFDTMMRTNADISMRVLKKLAGRLTEAQFRVAAMQVRPSIGRVMLQLRHELDHSMAPNKATLPQNLPDFLGIDDLEFKKCLDKLVEKNLIVLTDDNVFSIVDNDEYARYLKYLELHDRYGFFD